MDDLAHVCLDGWKRVSQSGVGCLGNGMGWERLAGPVGWLAWERIVLADVWAGVASGLRV